MDEYSKYIYLNDNFSIGGIKWLNYLKKKKENYFV